MLIRKIKILLIAVSLLAALSVFVNKISAETSPTPTPNTQALSELQNKINDLQKKISDTQSQQKTLSSQISVMDNQIKLTEFRIESTKAQLLSLNADIDTADKKIVKLERGLSSLTKVLLNRIVATYKVGSSPSFEILLSSSNASNFFTRLNYLKIAQEHDKRLIYETEQAKVDYANQKNIFEEKKEKVDALRKELEAYTAQLDQEKKSRQTLLEVTKNDEKRYQQMLAQARAEYEAILGIVAGKGNEAVVGSVSEGQIIATVISGASCNSGGTHLHFIVTENGANKNPFSYLSSISSENCSGSSCGSGDGDAFNPSGSWIWPLEDPIRLTQGYGSTWATRNDPFIRQIYSFHNGIDISGSSLAVKAVKSGTVYRGSYSVGCALRYSKLVHNEGGFVTYYLHVN